MADHVAHSEHDELLVAALAADDLDGVDRNRATALLAGCPDCAQLHADLLSIATATSSQLPTPVRTSDFRLTEADAARLRPVGWRRILGGLRTSPATVLRPVGLGLMVVGLAGVTLTALPGIGTISTGSSAGAAPNASGLEQLRQLGEDDPAVPNAGEAVPEASSPPMGFDSGVTAAQPAGPAASSPGPAASAAPSRAASASSPAASIGPAPVVAPATAPPEDAGSDAAGSPAPFALIALGGVGLVALDALRRRRRGSPFGT